ncbi:hypothetical protein ENLAB_17270 [Enterococcus innesii]|uniref:Uncharacterized protein n=1 Tax=Enterococcus innesii TaxID=2839759 RepID=A0ABN6NPJ4_9ENTE|nr:hypothetical protein ENLAB_17270 [Enterococcus innesii]
MIHKILPYTIFVIRTKRKKVQLDLERVQLPKHVTVNSFEDFIERYPSDLIEYVLDTFKLSGRNESTPLSSKKSIARRS